MNRRARLMLALSFAVAAAGCGGSSKSPGGNDMGTTSMCGASGPVGTSDDTHCGKGDAGSYLQMDPTQCTVDAGDGDGDSGGSDFGATMNGSAGYDDDCKYFVSFTVEPICENQGTRFTVTLKNAIDMSPVTYSGDVRLEAFLDDTHPANTSGVTTTALGGGVFELSHVVFDAPGRWTARFHFFEECTDSPTSPHGHAAFYVQVP